MCAGRDKTDFMKSYILSRMYAAFIKCDQETREKLMSVFNKPELTALAISGLEYRELEGSLSERMLEKIEKIISDSKKEEKEENPNDNRDARYSY